MRNKKGMGIKEIIWLEDRNQKGVRYHSVCLGHYYLFYKLLYNLLIIFKIIDHLLDRLNV